MRASSLGLGSRRSSCLLSAFVVSAWLGGAVVSSACTEVPPRLSLECEPDSGLVTEAVLRPPDGGVNGSGPVVYPGTRTWSPIDEGLARHLKDIAARGQGRAQVFIKVGDMVPAPPVDGGLDAGLDAGADGGSDAGLDGGVDGGVNGAQFLDCFEGRLRGKSDNEVNVHLGTACGLAPTLPYFSAINLTPVALTQRGDGGLDVTSSTSWTRRSLAARVGERASWFIRGSPSPLERELDTTRPRFAVVALGTADLASNPDGGGLPLLDRVEAYETAMRELTDALIARGVVPLLTTVPPRTDAVASLRATPVFGGVVRAIAQGRQVPLVDLQRRLLALGPPYGLGDGGVELSYDALRTSCHLDEASLGRYGYNLRNFAMLVGLDRLRQVFDEGQAALDVGSLRLSGAGTPGTPFEIPSLPFGELRDLRQSSHRPTTSSSCAGAPALTGPQYVYRLVLERATAVRVLLLDGGRRALQVSVWSGPSPQSCLATGPSLLTRTLPAGVTYLAVDAPAAADGGSEYNLSVTECLVGDPACL